MNNPGKVVLVLQCTLLPGWWASFLIMQFNSGVHWSYFLKNVCDRFPEILRLSPVCNWSSVSID